MSNVERHLISEAASVREALIKLDQLASDAILFLVNESNHLLGSLTDGDLRRGFIKGLGFEDDLKKFIQPHPAYIILGEDAIQKLEYYKEKNFKIVPVIDQDNVIMDVINFRHQSTILPLDAVLMAGGEGKRLLPLTEKTPKPLLKVGDKPIIEYNIDRLNNVGINNIYLSVNYLADQLVDYFGNGSAKGLCIRYIREDKPLGTIGSVLLADDYAHEDLLVMNSDLLTNIDFSDFYKSFKESGADMAVAATSYNVNVPYAVLEADEYQNVKSLKEKPRYTYYSNAGIYIIKRKILEMIPRNTKFDVTELMEKVLEMNHRLITYPINGYWLDIGKHEDYKKAQEDIKHLKM